MPSDLQKDREEALLAAEAAMALRMKEGLVEYKQGFSKRVATFAAIFVTGAAVGFVLSGGQNSNATPSDWAGDMASFHAIGATFNQEESDANRVFEALEHIYELPELSFLSSAFLRVDGENVIAMGYETQSGEQVGFYRTLTKNPDLSMPVVGLRQGLQAATWTKGGVKHLLIGGTDAQLIWNAANKLSAN